MVRTEGPSVTQPSVGSTWEHLPRPRGFGMASMIQPSEGAFSQMNSRSGQISVKCHAQLAWAELADQGHQDGAVGQCLYVFKLGTRR